MSGILNTADTSGNNQGKLFRKNTGCSAIVDHPKLDLTVNEHKIPWRAGDSESLFGVDYLQRNTLFKGKTSPALE